jgi:hypothetical protein
MHSFNTTRVPANQLRINRSSDGTDCCGTIAVAWREWKFKLTRCMMSGRDFPTVHAPDSSVLVGIIKDEERRA